MGGRRPLQASGVTPSRAADPRAPGRDPSRRGSLAVEPEHHDPAGYEFGWPEGVGIAGRHGDSFSASGSIGDNAAGDGAADLLTPELLAGRGVEGIKVAADVAEKR